MRLKAAVLGNLEKLMRDNARALEVGATRGVRDTGKELRRDFGQVVAAGGLPVKLQKAFDMRVYPRRGYSLKAAAMVKSKANRIHDAFAKGGVIRAKTGRFLVVPLPGAIRLGLHKSLRRSGGSRPRRWSEVRPAIDRFGALRLVKLAGGRFLLVADQVTAGGRRAKTSRTRDGAAFSRINRRGQNTMPLFLLTPQVRQPKRLDFGAARARARRRLPLNVAAAQVEELAKVRVDG